MKKIILPFVLIAVLAPAAQAKLNVVATTPDLASIAKEIGGDKIALRAVSFRDGTVKRGEAKRPIAEAAAVEVLAAIPRRAPKDSRPPA